MSRSAAALALGLALMVPSCRPSGDPAADAPADAGTYRRPRLIDAHTHLSPFAIPTIRRIMDDSGVDVMVNLSGGNQADEDLYYAVKMAKLMPGKVVNCYNPDWTRVDEPDFGVVEAQRLAESVQRYDFRCLKIAKALGLFVRHRSGILLEVDDPSLDPLWTAAGRLDVPVYVHVADPKAFFQPCDSTNERWKELQVHPHWCFHGQDYPSFDGLLDAFDRVIARHPETTFIGVHMGNDSEDPARVARTLDAYPNYYVDVAARVPEFGRHPAPEMRAFFVKYQDRVLFGTDTGISPRHLMLGSSGDDNPGTEDARTFYSAHFRYFETADRQIAHPTPIQGDWKIDAIGLPPKVLDKLYRKNAERLLKLPAEVPPTVTHPDRP
jgi:predicted TIM-barrel fold metal-dependent hydrolase